MPDDHLAPRATETIPVIDVAALVCSGDKRSAAEAIGRACRDFGFFTIVNHGLTDDLIARAFAETRRFFAQPDEAKMALHIAHSAQHRGYFPLFEENTDPELTADLKEGFDLAMELGPEAPEVMAGLPLCGPNVWPENLPGFRETITAYYDQLCNLARQLLTGFAISLDLPEDYFADKVDRPLAQLRLLHYPPQATAQDDRTMGCGVHSDYGCLTILAQDKVAGLEIVTPGGQWIEVPPMPGSLVINTGDQMARLTNEVYPATKHRVVNRSGRERFSMPFFFDPNYHAVIEPLASCVPAGEAPKYPPITSGAYLKSRLDATFTYRRDKA